MTGWPNGGPAAGRRIGTDGHPRYRGHHGAGRHRGLRGSRHAILRVSPIIEALHLAVYDTVIEESARRSVTGTGRGATRYELARTRAVLSELVDLILADPRKGRILVLLETTASPALGRRSLQESSRFAGMVLASTASSRRNPGLPTDDLMPTTSAAGLTIPGRRRHQHDRCGGAARRCRASIASTWWMYRPRGFSKRCVRRRGAHEMNGRPEGSTGRLQRHLRARSASDTAPCRRICPAVRCSAGPWPSRRSRWSASGGAELTSDPFTLGVASGEPVPDGVVIWTRLAPAHLWPRTTASAERPGEAVYVEWEVATDDRFRQLSNSAG